MNNRKNIINIPDALLFNSINKSLFRDVLIPSIINTDLKAGIHLSQTCKWANRLFRPSIKADLANKLLQCVINSDWTNIEKFVLHYPSLMYQEATAIDISNKSIKISAAKYAIYICDVLTQDIFEECAAAHNQLERYKHHVSRQKKRFSLDSYIKS